MKIFLKDAHNFSIKDSFEFLETDSSGLSVKEVSKRQEFFGPNLLPTQPPPTIFKIFIRQFLNPLIYILSFIYPPEKTSSFRTRRNRVNSDFQCNP